MTAKKNELGCISSERANQLAPYDIPLKYLIEEYKIEDDYIPDCQINPVAPVDSQEDYIGYDISIDIQDILSFPSVSIKNKQAIKTALSKSMICSVAKIDQIKVMDLIDVGVTFCGKVSDTMGLPTNKKYRYSNFNKFVSDINDFVNKEIKRELEYSKTWENQAEIIKDSRYVF